MEPISTDKWHTIGWYGGLPVLKPENFYFRSQYIKNLVADNEDVWSDISEDGLVLVSCRKRPKLSFNF